MRNSLHVRTRADDGAVFMRSVTVPSNSFDRATRTFIGAVLATSAPVRHRGMTEILDLAGGQYPESLPITLDHRNDVRSTIGRMTNLRVVGDELLGDGRLTADPSVDWLVERMSDGTVGALSVGFTVARWRDNADRSRTATDWRPIHAAIVQSPADERAGIRSADDDDIEDRNGSDADRIRALGRELGRRNQAAEAIAEGLTYDEFRTRMRNGSYTVDITTTTHNLGTLDNPDAYRRAAVDSIVCRMTGDAPQGAARELAGSTWVEFHRQHLRRRGQSVTGLSDNEIVTRALSTSDLPLIAGEAVNINVRRTYEAAQSPSAALAGSRNVPDFRTYTEALVDWTTLSVGKVGELGEFKNSFVSEDGERYVLGTVGGITGVSRQVYINGAGRLGSLSQAQGRRMAADVSDRRIAYLTQANLAGPTMRDTNPVFHATRGNIAPLDDTDVGTVIESVLAARAAMSKRKGAGDVMIGQLPRFWMVPVEFEGTAIRALATINAAESAAVNPLAGKLEVIPEPRLASASTSYLACAPASFDGLVQVGLDGAPGPMTESRWGFEIDAIQFKIRLDVAFGWVEWRSWTRLDHS